MKISIVIPYYEMKNGDFFLNRCMESIEKQSFKDYEIVVSTDKGGWAANHNAGIKKAKGELIKFLHMDDYLYHEFALQEIVDKFKGQWLVSGCIHTDGHQFFNPHMPKWNDKIIEGINTIGGPSVLTIKNQEPLLFDEKMTWLVDCDYYQRMYDKFGEPVFLETLNVAIGIHDGQATNLIPDEIKLSEHNYIKEKYGNKIV